jgi:hypothetical protein
MRNDAFLFPSQLAGLPSSSPTRSGEREWPQRTDGSGVPYSHGICTGRRNKRIAILSHTVCGRDRQSHHPAPQPWQIRRSVRRGLSPSSPVQAISGAPGSVETGLRRGALVRHGGQGESAESGRLRSWGPDAPDGSQSCICCNQGRGDMWRAMAHNDLHPRRAFSLPSQADAHATLLGRYQGPIEERGGSVEVTLPVQLCPHTPSSPQRLSRLLHCRRSALLATHGSTEVTSRLLNYEDWPV